MRLSLNFSNPTNSKLTFDVAHACYGGQYTDTLAVLVSTDCGITFTQVYKKWASTLATAPNSSNFFTPDSSQWRTDTIDLAAFSGTPHLLVAFRNIGLWGNNIYVDNINIISSNVAVNEIKTPNPEIYPNPIQTWNAGHALRSGILLSLYPLAHFGKAACQYGGGTIFWVQF